MNEELIIIRKRPAQPGVKLAFNLPAGGDPPPAPLPFIVESIQEDARELSSIRGESGVEAAGVALPVRLYAPLKGGPAVPGQQRWGLEAVGVHESSCSGLGATVAIIDSGIDIKHKAFDAIRERGDLVQRDFTNEGDGDPVGHGTHCAATVFGDTVGGEPVGVAPGVRRALIAKVVGRHFATSTAVLAQAIQWAFDEKQGANIVSMSLGVDLPAYVARLLAEGFPLGVAVSRAMQRHRETVDLFGVMAGLARHTGRHTLLVAAAGNTSQVDQNPEYVAGLDAPAAAAGFMSVGALQQLGPGRFRVADFSNGGATVCAPGVDIASARAASTEGFVSWSGTSMAAPHVAGVAALWLERLGPLQPGARTDMLSMRVAGSGAPDGIEPERIADAGTGLVQAPRG